MDIDNDKSLELKKQINNITENFIYYLDDLKLIFFYNESLPGKIWKIIGINISTNTYFFKIQDRDSIQNLIQAFIKIDEINKLETINPVIFQDFNDYKN